MQTQETALHLRDRDPTKAHQNVLNLKINNQHHNKSKDLREDNFLQDH